LKFEMKDTGLGFLDLGLGIGASSSGFIKFSFDFTCTQRESCLLITYWSEST